MATIYSLKPSVSEMDYGNRVAFEQLSNADKIKLASVRITEYPDSGDSNPEPISANNEGNFEDFLSPQFLREITGKNSLLDVRFLDLQVDTSETSIGNLGHLLPNLVELKLSNSTINSIRDIGTSLADLATLWLSRCCLVDLDGISCFCSLKELYLSYNEIDDVSSVSMLDCLEVLDLEGNNIDDIAQVEFLGLCSKLRSLTLTGNPVEMCPNPDTREHDLKFYDYRSAVAKAVPQLRILDDEPFIYDMIDGQRIIHSRSIRKKNEDSQFKEDLLILQDCIKALPPIGEEDLEPSQEIDAEGRVSSLGRHRPSSGRSGSARNRPASSRSRPLSSRNRPMSSRNRNAFPNSLTDRPGTSHQRPETTRPDSGRGIESPDNMDQDDSSDLTHGSKQVLCGNPVRALLARRKELKGTLRLKLGRDSPEANIDKFKPEHSYHDDDNDDGDNSVDRLDVFEDLKRWRENFERNSIDISTTVKQPQSPSLDDENRSSSLSPTPPAGDPTRMRSLPRRHVRKAPAEPPRPQTAFDFRSGLNDSVMTSQNDARQNNDVRKVITKSLDMNHLENRVDVTNSLAQESSKTQQQRCAKSNESARSTQSPDNSISVRSRQLRPGTAAAASKRTSKKHF